MLGKWVRQIALKTVTSHNIVAFPDIKIVVRRGPIFFIYSWQGHSVAVPKNTHKTYITNAHDDVIKWKHFLRHWPFVRGIHRSPVNYPHKGQWRGALMFSLICAWINPWVNNRQAGALRRHRAHYDVTVIAWNAVEVPTGKQPGINDDLWVFLRDVGPISQTVYEFIFQPSEDMCYSDITNNQTIG